MIDFSSLIKVSFSTIEADMNNSTTSLEEFSYFSLKVLLRKSVLFGLIFKDDFHYLETCKNKFQPINNWNINVLNIVCVLMSN